MNFEQAGSGGSSLVALGDHLSNLGLLLIGKLRAASADASVLTQEQIAEFLKGSQTIEFTGQNRAELYGFVQRVLVGQEYALQSKKPRGVIRAYLSKVTGLSLPQMTRLIRQYRQAGVVSTRSA